MIRGVGAGATETVCHRTPVALLTSQQFENLAGASSLPAIHFLQVIVELWSGGIDEFRPAIEILPCYRDVV
jgi:hypothetical protein